MKHMGMRKLSVIAAILCIVLFAAISTAVFAEDAVELTPLGTPTDVHWDTEIPGKMVFTGAQPSQGRYYVAAYRLTEDGREQVFSTSWSGLEGDRIFKLDSLLAENLLKEDGDYIFTIKAEGDRKTYSDGEVVESDVFHYIKPDASLPAPFNVHWNWPYAECEFDESTEFTQYAYGLRVEFFYAEKEEDEPIIVGASWGGSVSSTYRVYDSVLRRGAGYYYVRMSVYSRDINVVTGSEYSELSAAYYYTPKEVSEELDDVLANAAAGASPDSIRSSVTDIGKSKLHEAMVADNDDTGVVKQLEELEQATGATMTVDVSEDVNEFDESLVSVVGALLNPLSQGNVTLNITKPKTNDVIPELYNSSVAIRFGMDLDGLWNTSYLQVPVKITLPIPETINPSFLKILHYPANDDPTVELQPQEIITPNVYEKDGQWYASFVLDHFSDFVMTVEETIPAVAAPNGLWIGDTKVSEDSLSDEGWEFNSETNSRLSF